MRAGLVLLYCLLPCVASADWYSGSGSAVVFDDNRQLARQQAARQALRSALLQAGVSLTALSALRHDEPGAELFTLQSGLPVAQIVIEEEHQRDNRLSVTLKADIWPQQSLCEQRAVAKAVLLAPLSLAPAAAPVTLNNSGLMNEINQRLFAALRAATADFLVKAVAPGPLAAPEQYHATAAQQQLRYLAESAQAQFIISGRLLNLAFGVQPAGLLKKQRWVRQFAMELSVFDGVSGNLIQSKTYQSRTLWPYAMTTETDPASDQLWRSDYGIELQRLLHDAVDDSAALLSCVRVKAQVIRVTDHSVAISAGSRQGLQVGDRFSLTYSDSFTDSWGNRYQSATPEPAQLEVIRVYPDHADTRPVNQRYPAAVQVRDQVQQDSFREPQYAN
ncbi:flagellar assembly protein T N-terminal domain-containing protein [Rheinheimera sp. YQF-2]|uniref:Flagellar assembly protein T N-terminal domain-containing protein n=1 Tax=Rheinheimera lutimaris TaxID=2740584 RepID=A0A7Y5ATM6_9GAMM|nr:flagellar assembly protein T N-terminal domain-containing protein [Rheinheimera lutimaris]NRQ44332.1 flagellar assembly protein T N-terminal domain-containing protein [Rheinheimera lutimaris]